MPDTPLKQLSAHGQSVWIDFLSRTFVEDGDLEALVREGVKGVTSNPTIFQAAIAEGDAYDEQLREVLKTETEPKEVFLALAVEDIRGACDILRPHWDEAGENARDGWVSLEVDPTLAHDTEGTIEEAKRLHALVDRPNLFIKIPATKAGLPAIEETIAAGIPVNVTLIFSLERHREVAEAYVRGVQRLADAGGDLVADGVGRLVLRLARRHRGRQAARRDRRPRRAQGHARDRQRQARLRDLQGDLRRRAVGGAARQGRLGAALPVGVDVDQEPRLPRRDLRRGADRPRHRQHDAARDRRGVPGPRRGRATRSSEDVEGARRTLEAFAAAGIDYDDVVETLEREGVEKFAKSFEQLFADVEAKRDALVVAA